MKILIVPATNSVAMAAAKDVAASFQSRSHEVHVFEGVESFNPQPYDVLVNIGPALHLISKLREERNFSYERFVFHLNINDAVFLRQYGFKFADMGVTGLLFDSEVWKMQMTEVSVPYFRSYSPVPKAFFNIQRDEPAGKVTALICEPYTDRNWGLVSYLSKTFQLDIVMPAAYRLEEVPQGLRNVPRIVYHTAEECAAALSASNCTIPVPRVSERQKGILEKEWLISQAAGVPMIAPAARCQLPLQTYVLVGNTPAQFDEHIHSAIINPQGLDQVRLRFLRAFGDEMVLPGASPVSYAGIVERML